MHSVVAVASAAQLAAAVAEASAGTTIDAAAGDYDGFQLSASGTAAEPITINFAAGAVINGTPGSGNGMIDLSGDSFITINGADIADGSNGARAGIWGGGYANDNVTGITIENSTCNDCTDWGCLFGFVNDSTWTNDVFSNTQVQHGLYIGNSSSDDTVEGCTFFGNYACGFECNEDVTSGGPGYGSGLVIEGNTFYDNARGAGASINFDGVQNSVIENNVIDDAQRNGIALYQINGALPSTGNIIVNNTIDVDSNGATGYAAISLIDGAADCTVLNNILSSQENTLSIDAASQVGLVCNFNIFGSAPIDPTGNGDYTLVSEGGSAISLAAWQALGFDKNSLEVSNVAGLFVNAGGGNFQLASGSAALGAGTTTDAPAADISGLVRTPPISIGAYQGSGIAAPVLPTLSLSGPSSAQVGQKVTVVATTTPGSQPISSLAFFLNGTQIGTVAGSSGTASYTFKNPSAGGDTFTVVGTYAGGTITSNPVTVIVSAALPPSIQLSGPATAIAGHPVTVTASSTDLALSSFTFSINGILEQTVAATETEVDGVLEMTASFTFTLQHASAGGDLFGVTSGSIKGSTVNVVVLAA